MSEDWKNKDIQPYLKDKPANWSDTDNDWVAFKGNEKLEQELASIKQTQSKILEKLDGTIDTQLTGSNVEEAIPVSVEVTTKGEIIFENIEVASGSSISTPQINVDFDYYTSYVRGVSAAHPFEVSVEFRATPYHDLSVFYETEPFPNNISQRNVTTGNERWIPYTDTMNWKIKNKSNDTQEYTVLIWRFNG